MLWSSVARPVDLHPICECVALKLFQVIGQMREHMHLNRSCGIAKLLPLRDALCLTVALEAHEPQCLIVPVNPLVVEDEERRFFRVSGYESLAFSRISATCITRSGILSRRMMPSRCIKQDESKPTTTSAPACR